MMHDEERRGEKREKQEKGETKNGQNKNKKKAQGPFRPDKRPTHFKGAPWHLLLPLLLLLLSCVLTGKKGGTVTAIRGNSTTGLGIGPRANGSQKLWLTQHGRKGPARDPVRRKRTRLCPPAPRQRRPGQVGRHLQGPAQEKLTWSTLGLERARRATRGGGWLLGGWLLRRHQETRQGGRGQTGGAVTAGQGRGRLYCRREPYICGNDARRFAAKG